MTRPAARTVCQLLSTQAASRPAAPAISWQRDGLRHTLTWDQYREQVYITASALLRLGVQAGRSVAVLAGNRVEHLLTDMAAAHCGAASVSLYATLRDRARPSRYRVIPRSLPTQYIRRWPDLFRSASIIIREES